MLWILITILILSIIVNAVLGFLLQRFVRRVLQYDDLYQYLIDDVETNLVQFDRMRKSSLLSDDDQVRSAHKNMMTMAMRMDEFANKMEEIVGKKLRKVTRPMKPVNVTEEVDKISRQDQ